jgi:hypothetical protein
VNEPAWRFNREVGRRTDVEQILQGGIDAAQDWGTGWIACGYPAARRVIEARADSTRGVDRVIARTPRGGRPPRRDRGGDRVPDYPWSS